MSFDLNTWKAEFQTHLPGWQKRMRSAGVNSAYYFIAASAFLPIAQAFQGGSIEPYGFAVVASGIGANLLANIVQHWRDEANAADKLQAAVQDDPALQVKLDRFLLELDALRQAEAALTEADKAWFAETIQRELADLGSTITYTATLTGDGAIAQGEGATAVGAGATYVGGDLKTDGGAVVRGDVHTGGGDFVGRDAIQQEGEGNVLAKEGATVIVAQEGAKVIVGEEAIPTPAIRHDEALKRYLRHLISNNRYLELRGIHSGGRVVNIQLAQIYVTLRATQRGAPEQAREWLQMEAELAPGEAHRRGMAQREETDTVQVEQALAKHRHLVVLGDPGSGKTTLLRYLALLYARDMAEGTRSVQEKLGLDESGYLPILLPLRKIGAFLETHRPQEDGTEGHALLLEFLYQALKNQQMTLPKGFFERYIEQGRAVLLLDGLDEVADPTLRRRVSQLADAFARAYPACRFVVTSRVLGYIDTVQLGGEFAVTTVQAFSLDDIRAFLTHWHQAVNVTLMGPGEEAARSAEAQTNQLMEAIQSNDRILELAITPLMLTVIALVHRDRIKLPDRRAELYAEAINVLLGKRDEAHGIKALPILADKPFDTGDKRLLLQEIARFMHEGEQKEIEAETLRRLVSEHFAGQLGGRGGVRRATERFLQNIAERSGLLIARGEGVYAFSHLTFQEYLTAVAVADREDYLVYTLARSGQEWWREVILLEAGYLSTQGKSRTTRLIRAIAEKKDEPEPYHNLVLAAECLRDVGETRVEGNLRQEIVSRLQKELDTPTGNGFLGNLKALASRGMTAETLTRRRIAAANALGRIQAARYWSLPYGEPEWVEIPAGPFLMGTPKEDIPTLVKKYGGKSEWYEDETPQHEVHLPAFYIARVPVTNAQYLLFVRATGHDAPEHWRSGQPPKGKELHPVVNVTWYDALAYCDWLSSATGKPVTLPSEAEWEKAARGTDGRIYPWGNTFDASRCNSREMGLGDTTPVGIFPKGASPYGVLALSGNVWEWTRSLYEKYPYDPADGRENLEASRNMYRVLRGGAFYNYRRYVRAAVRDGNLPNTRNGFNGFRVVLSPMHSER